jgi:hypothetical protein
MKSEGLSFVGISRFRLLVAVVLSIFLVSCGSSQSGTETPVKTGAVSFAVEWEPPPVSQASADGKALSAHPLAPAINVCSDYGIANMTMQVLSGQTVLVETSVPCENHGATLNNVPSDNNLVLHLMGSVQGVGNAWNGYSASFTLAAGETKDVGKVTMSYTGNDATPPTVLSVTPTDNATHVLNNSTIRVVFSEKMAVNTVQDNGAIVVTDNGIGPVAGSIVYNPIDYSAVFTPTAPLTSGGKVSVSVTGVVTDAAGNKLASSKAWNFLVHVPGQFLNPFLLELDDYPKYTVSSEIAMSGIGDAIAVWEQFDGTRMNIISRRYSSSTASWIATEVLEYTDGDAGSPRIAMGGNGNATVVWEQLAGTRRNIMFTSTRLPPVFGLRWAPVLLATASKTQVTRRSLWMGSAMQSPCGLSTMVYVAMSGIRGMGVCPASLRPTMPEMRTGPILP